MVLVLSKNCFKLPRVDKEKFVYLIRYGLDYNRDKGAYSIKSYNNIEQLSRALEDILGEEVVFLQSCIRCGKDFPCGPCKYEELCSTKDLPFSCVCPQCLRDRKQFEEYLTKF